MHVLKIQPSDECYICLALSLVCEIIINTIRCIFCFWKLLLLNSKSIDIPENWLTSPDTHCIVNVPYCDSTVQCYGTQMYPTVQSCISLKLTPMCPTVCLNRAVFHCTYPLTSTVNYCTTLNRVLISIVHHYTGYLQTLYDTITHCI